MTVKPNYRMHYHINFWDCEKHHNNSATENHEFHAPDDRAALRQANVYMKKVARRMHIPEEDIYHGVHVWDVKLTGLERITYVPKQIKVERTTRVPITPITLQRSELLK